MSHITRDIIANGHGGYMPAWFVALFILAFIGLIAAVIWAIWSSKTSL